MNLKEIESKNQSLPLHEWSVVILFCLILITLASFAILKPKSKTMVGGFSQKIEEKGTINIKIEGAVSQPGIYSISPKTSPTCHDRSLSSHHYGLDVVLRDLLLEVQHRDRGGLLRSSQ